jgi:ATP-dependent DNA ligase
MKKLVKVIDETGNIQECVVLQGTYMEGKSASLGLALLYSVRNEDNLYVIDVDFVKAILDDINKLNNIIHKLD